MRHLQETADRLFVAAVCLGVMTMSLISASAFARVLDVRYAEASAIVFLVVFAMWLVAALRLAMRGKVY